MPDPLRRVDGIPSLAYPTQNSYAVIEWAYRGARCTSPCDEGGAVSEPITRGMPVVRKARPRFVLLRAHSSIPLVTTVLAAVLLITAPACVFDLREEEPQVVSQDGEAFTLNGRRNTPVGEKELALREHTAAGPVELYVYDSEIGPCFDVVAFENDRNADCLAASSVSDGGHIHESGVAQEVDAGDEPQWIWYGFVSPQSRLVLLTPDGEDAPVEAHPVDLPGTDAQAFITVPSASWTGYVLTLHDKDGCVLARGRPQQPEDPIRDLVSRDCSAPIQSEALR
jgi:hypothetical protein